MATEKIDFKKSIERLDEIVNLISNKALSLDESLKLYEEGHQIIKSLSKELELAEQKIENIVSIEEK